MTKRILAMFLVVCMVTALVPFTFITASAAPVSSDDAIQIIVDVTNTYSDTYVNGIIGWASSDTAQSVEDIYGLSADNATFQWFYKALFVYDEENNGYIVTQYELPGEGANQYDSWTLGENRFVLMCYSGTTNAGDLQAFQNLEVGDIFTTTASFDQFLNTGSATIYLTQFGEDMIKRTDATIDLNIGWPSHDSFVEPYDQTYFFADGSKQYNLGGFYNDTNGNFPGTNLAYWHKVLFTYNEETEKFVVTKFEIAGEGKTDYSTWTVGLNDMAVIAYNTAPCYNDLVSLQVGDELTLVGTTFERIQTGDGSPDDVLTGAQLVFDVEEEVTPAYPDVFDISATSTSLCYDEGETVYLRIKLNPILLEGGLSGVGFTVNYDSEKLTLISDLDEDNDNALDCLNKVPNDTWENLSNVKHTVDDEGIATPVNDGVINVIALTVSTDTADFISDVNSKSLLFEFAFELKEGATGDLLFTVPDESILAMQNTETGFDKYTGTGFERVIKAHSTSTVADCTTEARCDTCGKLMEAAKGHTPGPEADCENDQVCTVCGEVLNAKLGHDFDDAWTYDETNHWHACANGCDEVSDLAEHTFVGDDCECGYTRGHVHVPGPEADCENDQICTACGEVLTEKLGHSFTNYVSDGNATCTSDGTKTAKCDRCDKTDTVTEEDSALGHDFNTEWKYDATNHWHECANGCGETSDLAEHTYDGDTCECGYERDHVHVPGAEADCENDQVCTACGEVLNEKLGHSFTNYVSDNNATCETDGTKTAKCDRCDKTDTIDDEGSALGHSFTNYVSDGNATCLEDGTETAKCDRCDKTETRTDEGSALGHSFTNYVSDGNATCETDGTKTAKCDRCDVTDTIDDEGSALGHSFTNYVSNGDATCETDG
ncbi:MAG: hypothetical protein IKM22_04455, partial [Clostridia bacterium]|nr:hypothetical protein [Clostridia bacterium]